jgi:signal transduction histidine kinase
VTSAAADMISSPALGWRNRLGFYLLAQALIVLACILILRQPLPEPSASYQISEAILGEDGVQRPVRLPYHLTSRVTSGNPPVFTLSFDRPANEADHAWSILLPRFISGVEVAVNGTVILDSRLHPAANRADRNSPEIAVIPESLLRGGANMLTVRLHAWGPLTGFLDRVFVGPDEALRPAYERRALLFLTLPVVFSAWQAILAVLLGVMWLKRRHEPTYGVLAAAMAIGVLQAFVSAPVGQSDYAGLNAMLIASAPLEAACVLIFIIAFLRLERPRYFWIVLIPGLVIAAAGLAGNAALVRQAYLVLGPPTVFLSLSIICILVARAAVARGDGVAMLLGCAVTIVMTFLVHDLLSVFGIAIERPILVSRLSYSALLVAIGIGLTWRFAAALNEVDSFAGRMVTLVREAEDKLRASLALEEERARAAALANERNRLTRDLHDGLGGQLVSIVALSERGVWEGARIGEAARAALKDLRLVIDAMDDIDGDLMLALGTWRERTAAQLRPHGIALDWHVLVPEGMPVHPELRPWHVIQFLRLLDEAVTNAVKHAGATRIKVRIETIGGTAGDQRGRITVEDDGHGFILCDQGHRATDAPNNARGLANMHKRTARCGAQLEITSGPGGTRVRLDLPRSFPDAELAGG